MSRGRGVGGVGRGSRGDGGGETETGDGVVTGEEAGEEGKQSERGCAG